MNTGTLTPRSNNNICTTRFSGGFGQPDGFASILEARVKQDGGLCLTLTYRMVDSQEHTWSIELTNEQRGALIDAISGYEPRLWEEIDAR